MFTLTIILQQSLIYTSGCTEAQAVPQSHFSPPPSGRAANRLLTLRGPRSPHQSCHRRRCAQLPRAPAPPPPRSSSSYPYVIRQMHTHTHAHTWTHSCTSKSCVLEYCNVSQNALHASASPKDPPDGLHCGKSLNVHSLQGRPGLLPCCLVQTGSK
ncbi:hypothetical protein K431DRAFT_137788 [Polychaeton citri CBS 116435]|uniref:Uncharacterized protein n=1 Tax=Polychaeton citri CBS 116435 TaxID=1314669 RepID=A0A9P4UMV9_9PEZI|nr:hypothetical protein K431DRAFT_137788 [Polychaeton citri CBS 116435]